MPLWQITEDLSCAWQAMLIRNRGEVLGTVKAPDGRAAKQAAAERFSHSDQQMARLALREMR